MRILLIILILFLYSCANTKSNGTYKSMQLKSSEGGFRLTTPNHWTYFERQGIDSYVGIIVTKEKDTLYFDLGRYSAPLEHHIYRDDEDEENYKARVAWRVINGYNVKFASHRSKTNSDFGVHFDSLWTTEDSENLRNKIKLTIYGFNLHRKTKKQLIKAVKAIQFIKD